MRDEWSESFDLCSPYSYEALRWKRYGREPPLVSGKIWLVAIAGLVLLGFLSADVALYEGSPTVVVQVTAVEWFIPGTSLATTAGFVMHASERVTVTLTCSTTCVRISGATVQSPFTLVGFSVVYHPDQYTNVTVQSPSTSYMGPIAIELSVG
jgi:hypothetical protein